MSTPIICILLFGAMLLLLYFNCPLVVAIGLPTAGIMFTAAGVAMPSLAQKSLSSIDSFTMMAVPLFMFAGKIMEVGGLSRRIVRMADCLVGWISGGLGHVLIVASAFFGALTGSAVATCAAIGSTLIPEMKVKGYPAGWVAGLQSVAASLGVLIPPSIPLIIYGVSTGTSVGKLFIAGIVPGCFLAFCLMVAVFITFRKKKIQVTREVITGKALFYSFLEAIPALIMPVIILGGIYTGVFTPSEAGAVACTYGFLICTFFYKEINRENIHEIIGGAVTNTAFCMIIVTASGAFSWLLVMTGASDLLGSSITAISVNQLVFLLMANVILLFMGMFIETICAILIVTPILMPTVLALGIDPVHFGIIMVANLALGLTTPPVGENQYIAAKIAGITFEEELRGSVPFLIAGYAALILITAIPGLSTWLPELLQV